MHKITVLVESGNANNGYPTGLRYEREFEPSGNPRFWGDAARRAVRRLAADVNLSLERYVDLREGPELSADHPIRHRILSVLTGFWRDRSEVPTKATDAVLHELHDLLLTPEREAAIRAAGWSAGYGQGRDDEADGLDLRAGEADRG